LLDFVDRFTADAGHVGTVSSAWPKAFYAAARGTKQIWEVPNGQHIAGITTQPAEYERRVVAFFDSALLGAK
jgi:hypothetical protein